MYTLQVLKNVFVIKDQNDDVVLKSSDKNIFISRAKHIGFDDIELALEVMDDKGHMYSNLGVMGRFIYSYNHPNNINLH